MHHPAPRRPRFGTVLVAAVVALSAITALGGPPAFAQEAEPPGKPTFHSLTGGDGQVVVSFNAPSPGSTPITGYTVDSSNLTDPTEVVPPVDGASSPITVTGLTNGESYSFRVTAHNASGSTQSDPSTPLNVGVVPSFPGHPSTLPAGTVGVPYHYVVQAIGAPVPTVTWDQQVAPIPPGLSYDFVSRTISGTPTTAGTFWPSFEAHNALGYASLNPSFVIGESLGEPEPTQPPTTPAPSPGTSVPPPTTSGDAPTTSVQRAATPRTLPATGVDSTAPAVVAVLMLALGLGLSAFTTRPGLTGAYSKRGRRDRRLR